MRYVHCVAPDTNRTMSYDDFRDGVQPVARVAMGVEAVKGWSAKRGWRNGTTAGFQHSRPQASCAIGGKRGQATCQTLWSSAKAVNGLWVPWPSSCRFSFCEPQSSTLLSNRSWRLAAALKDPRRVLGAWLAVCCYLSCRCP